MGVEHYRSLPHLPHKEYQWIAGKKLVTLMLQEYKAAATCPRPLD